MSNRNIRFTSLLIALAFFDGMVQQFARGTHALLLQSGIPYGFVAIAVVYVWYRGDAEQRGYRRSPLLNVMVIALALIALPYYLFRSRGLSRGAAATGIFLAVIVASSALGMAGGYLAYFLRVHS
jgi:hypothetical protein